MSSRKRCRLSIVSGNCVIEETPVGDHGRLGKKQLQCCFEVNSWPVGLSTDVGERHLHTKAPEGASRAGLKCMMFGGLNVPAEAERQSGLLEDGGEFLHPCKERSFVSPGAETGKRQESAFLDSGDEAIRLYESRSTHGLSNCEIGDPSCSCSRPLGHSERETLEILSWFSSAEHDWHVGARVGEASHPGPQDGRVGSLSGRGQQGGPRGKGVGKGQGRGAGKGRSVVGGQVGRGPRNAREDVLPAFRGPQLDLSVVASALGSGVRIGDLAPPASPGPVGTAPPSPSPNPAPVEETPVVSVPGSPSAPLSQGEVVVDEKKKRPSEPAFAAWHTRRVAFPTPGFAHVSYYRKNQIPGGNETVRLLRERHCLYVQGPFVSRVPEPGSPRDLVWDIKAVEAISKVACRDVLSLDYLLSASHEGCARFVRMSGVHGHVPRRSVYKGEFFARHYALSRAFVGEIEASFSFPISLRKVHKPSTPVQVPAAPLGPTHFYVCEASELPQRFEAAERASRVPTFWTLVLSLWHRLCLWLGLLFVRRSLFKVSYRVERERADLETVRDERRLAHQTVTIKKKAAWHDVTVILEELRLGEHKFTFFGSWPKDENLGSSYAHREIHREKIQVPLEGVLQLQELVAECSENALPQSLATVNHLLSLSVDRRSVCFRLVKEMALSRRYCHINCTGDEFLVHPIGVRTLLDGRKTN